MLNRPTKRTAAIALAATAALSLAFVTTASASGDHAPAQAAPAAAAGLPSVSGSPQGAFNRIVDFYGAYIDASYDGDGKTADQLRSFYLAKPLQAELKKWEEANHANGVLRAQNVPLKWKVASTGSGMGKTNATVTLTWNGDGSAGSTTEIRVQADLKTQRITSITD
ncbi:hypothetical protein [Streptomyces sp. G-G2]|uniref:hypothetical protein n=1 Tax=Streptomyces sp. G-G2 TaxID=3046201 RepID=UPI0024BB9DDB|nr:hypothetical protein [Streptomyces sp. G-G2]MDJ0380025.1 hypothetical protein [Streptomyces sp. G-G2]